MLVSIIVAVTTATGILTLGFAVTAAIHGQNLAELYLELFPQVRGLPVPFRTQATAYAVFFTYVVGAAQIAIICRRRIGGLRR
jgi:hypothetical protein